MNPSSESLALLHLLQAYPNSRALVLSTENITQNWYFGEDRSMLIPNCLFRVGGAGIVLSNRCELAFALQPLVRSRFMPRALALVANANQSSEPPRHLAALTFALA